MLALTVRERLRTSFGLTFWGVFTRCCYYGLWVEIFGNFTCPILTIAGIYLTKGGCHSPISLLFFRVQSLEHWDSSKVQVCFCGLVLHCCLILVISGSHISFYTRRSIRVVWVASNLRIVVLLWWSSCANNTCPKISMTTSCRVGLDLTSTSQCHQQNQFRNAQFWP